jgi:hypothetical protein
MSLIEAISNVAVGFLVALLTQVIVFPLFELEVGIGEHLAISGLFTIASIARSYLLRRLFEAIRVRSVTSVDRLTRRSEEDRRIRLTLAALFHPRRTDRHARNG